jgi:hypothetical protein
VPRYLKCYKGGSKPDYYRIDYVFKHSYICLVMKLNKHCEDIVYFVEQRSTDYCGCVVIQHQLGPGWAHFFDILPQSDTFFTVLLKKAGLGKIKMTSRYEIKLCSGEKELLYIRHMP